MSGHCRLMTTALNEWAMTEDGIHHLRQINPLWSYQTILVEMENAFTRDEWLLALAEVKSLPDSFLPLYIMAWHEAYSAGIPFEIVSEPPEQPIDSARQGRVSVRIDYEETGVRMVVAHIHGHHASWLTKSPVLAV